jgi:hypothetical protein
VPAYSATQHAKYALVSNAIRDKHFENDFYAWIDIGYFRNSVKSNNFFQGLVTNLYALAQFIYPSLLCSRPFLNIPRAK